MGTLEALLFPCTEGHRPRSQALLIESAGSAQGLVTWVAQGGLQGGLPPVLSLLFLLPSCQGDLQERSLEHLRLADRSSLLSEIQALRAQLRMTHLQNQEKLQQLCIALTSAEARGSRQEHQLRRQGGCGLTLGAPWLTHLMLTYVGNGLQSPWLLSARSGQA